MKLDREEIQARLQNVPRDKCVLFALRLAMRVLPLLAVQRKKIQEVGQKQSKREAFYFWQPENKAKHLLAVYHAYSCCLESVIIEDVTDGYMIGYTPAYIADSNAAYVTVDDALCATYAAKVAVDTNHTNAAYAAAADAASDYIGIIEEIENDLSLLENLSVTKLLEKALWSNAVPDSWQQLMVDFKKDALSLDAGFQVWLDWYEARLQGKPIDTELLNKWNNIPDELKEQGAAKVNAYLNNLVENKVKQPLNRVRAIFIGYGEAGKTSLIRALHNEKVIKGKEAMTPGIEIRDWDIPDSEIKAHFWDFGGQVMAHATHQFFLRERCLYVLVLNARSEINSTEQAEYWLEHVKSFAKSAPVMLVGNKADETEIHLDMNYLTEKYPNISGFYSLSCIHAQDSYKAKFDSFKQDFCLQLQQVGTHQMLFTPEQFAVLEELRDYSSQHAFLPHKEFEAMCAKHGVSESGELNREWLLDILDKLGVVIHFPKLTFFSEEYVLNPRWLTHGVYTLMYAKQAQLTEAKAVAILRDKQISDENGNILDYPKDKCRFILEAMQEFKLSYRQPQERSTFIIPELLPSNRPENLGFDKHGALAFEFKFTGFLPRHIMPQLIVNNHQEIVNQTVWQNGVLLQYQDSPTQALLEVSYHDRIINVWVKGQDAKDYLAIIDRELLKTLGLLELDYDEYIELPLSACSSQDNINNTVTEKVDYRQLLNSVRNRIYTFPGKYNIYDLKKVLGIILPDTEFRNIYANNYTEDKSMSNTSVKLGNNNTIGGSVVAAEKIEKSFNSIQQSTATPEVKELLTQLLNEIKALNAKVPDSQEIKDISEDAETLINESNRESPRKKQYEFSLEGIKNTATTLGDIAKPVITIAKALGPLLLG